MLLVVHLILQDAWEDVDPDELSYEVTLIYIPKFLPCCSSSLSPCVSCIRVNANYFRNYWHWVKQLELRAEVFQLILLPVYLQSTTRLGVINMEAMIRMCRLLLLTLTVSMIYHSAWLLWSCVRCVICRVDYEDDESLTVLSCKHLYHPECINNWLKINKVWFCLIVYIW